MSVPYAILITSRDKEQKMKKQGKQYLVADTMSNGSVVCDSLVSAVVEYVAQRPILTVVITYVIPVIVITAIVSSMSVA
jgi:hypothetical protein